MLYKHRLGKGCFDNNTNKYHIGNITYKTCLGNYQNSSIPYLFNLFSQYQNNLLPYNGNYGEQPAKIIEVFNVIQGIIGDHEKELEKVRKYLAKQNGKLNGR